MWVCKLVTNKSLSRKSRVQIHKSMTIKQSRMCWRIVRDQERNVKRLKLEASCKVQKQSWIQNKSFQKNVKRIWSKLESSWKMRGQRSIFANQSWIQNSSFQKIVKRIWSKLESSWKVRGQRSIFANQSWIQNKSFQKIVKRIWSKLESSWKVSVQRLMIFKKQSWIQNKSFKRNLRRI